MIKYIQNFIKQESAGGIILLFATIIALILENTIFAPFYNHFLAAKLTIAFGQFALSKALLLWINDGLMVIFFLLVGLEIKREIIEGELNTRAKAILPLIAALGGMVVPCLIYLAFNYDNPIAIRGFAIPSATDIAFSLGILSLLRSRIPTSLKVFLTALAIMDDLGAIIIIAIFYTDQLSIISLLLACGCLTLLFIFNRFNVIRFAPYAIVGVVMWVCVLKSGVHATLTGVAIAMAYPLRCKLTPKISPSRTLEHNLLPWVAFGVLPLFAFANAGIPLRTFSISTLLEPIPLGIIAGLFIGKQLGIFTACWIAIRLKLAKLPAHASWYQLYAVATICGVGFTMSFFIGSLAFEGLGAHYAMLVRMGVLVGSAISAIVGAGLLLLKPVR